MKTLDFTDRSNPLGPPQKARHAARKALRGVALYPDETVPRLRRLIAKRQGVPSDSILFGRGTSGLFHQALRSFAPGVVAMPAPVLPFHVSLAERQGAAVLPVPGEPGTYSVPAERLAGALERADMLFLPNPHPITGAVLSGEELAPLIAQAGRLKKPVVVDESLIDFAACVSSTAHASRSPHVLVLRSFSLFFALADLRIGYALGSPETLSAIQTAGGPYPVGRLAEAAALLAMRDTAYFERTRGFIAEEKRYLRDKFRTLKQTTLYDSPINLLLLATEDAHLASSLRDAGVRISFFADGEHRTVLSLPVRRRPQNAFLAKTLSRLLS